MLIQQSYLYSQQGGRPAPQNLNFSLHSCLLSRGTTPAPRSMLFTDFTRPGWSYLHSQSTSWRHHLHQWQCWCWSRQCRPFRSMISWHNRWDEEGRRGLDDMNLGLTKTKMGYYRHLPFEPIATAMIARNAKKTFILGWGEVRCKNNLWIEEWSFKEWLILRPRTYLEAKAIFCDFWAYLAILERLGVSKMSQESFSIRCLKMSHVLQGPLYRARFSFRHN